MCGNQENGDNEYDIVSGQAKDTFLRKIAWETTLIWRETYKRCQIRVVQLLRGYAKREQTSASGGYPSSSLIRLSCRFVKFCLRDTNTLYFSKKVLRSHHVTHCLLSKDTI